MKKKSLVLGLLAMSLVMIRSVYAEGDGAFVTDYVEEEIILDGSRASIEPAEAAPLIEEYILSVNPDRDTQFPNDLSTKELAKRIAGVSHCFGIDPFVYTGLIHKESVTFNQRAKSPTGAVGFTQFTSIAMKEVNDQLGIRGNRYAQTSAINYFNGILTGSCLETAGGFKSFGDQYQPLWTKKPANQLTKASGKQATQMVKMLASNPEYALVYGAILMKVNYSMVKSGYKSGCYQYKKALTTHEIMKEVMMMYNGDGCTTQKKYQSDILTKFYPEVVSEDDGK